MLLLNYRIPISFRKWKLSNLKNRKKKRLKKNEQNLRDPRSPSKGPAYHGNPGTRAKGGENT